MSSESSEDENIQQLKDALDVSMFSSRSDATEGRDEKLSNRISLDEKTEQPNALRVTPEFQAFVAKRLAKIIDNELEEVPSVHSKQKQGKKKKKPKGGVRLLSSSSEYLSAEDPIIVSTSHKKQQAVDFDESSAAMERFSEAAVPSDWITSKESVKGWIPFEKGEVIKVKNGVCVEVIKKKLPDQTGVVSHHTIEHINGEQFTARNSPLKVTSDSFTTKRKNIEESSHKHKKHKKIHVTALANSYTE
ncbi:protein CUSTOS-like [Schistocerca nitens]|uniref:protein CUSTOS-like n=1 Tax=Schistocerca nitens TaxID=7011 RepID=UPI002118E14D|nr:protein CUSTOS-like [Schistocerca nitens]